jgi:hypothetical protein
MQWIIYLNRVWFIRQTVCHRRAVYRFFTRNMVCVEDG